MGDYVHIPVLLHEALEALHPHPGGHYLDATLGGAGHASAILEAIQPGGRLLGLDADPAALQAAEQRFQARRALVPPESYTLVHGNFRTIAEVARFHGFESIDGILFDLGVSSHQLDTPARGFSFVTDGPLDMRLDPTQGMSAADLIADLDEQQLADYLYHYGEERQSRRIARHIVARRAQHPIETTGDLSTIVTEALYGRQRAAAHQHNRPYRRDRIHPATRTFQALRIAVNRELEYLEAALPQAVSLLHPGGRLAVISFHSLEDRIVKWFFRREAGYREGDSEQDRAPAQAVRLRIVTKKPIEASDAEVTANPRSRSAKLRVAERTNEVEAVEA